MKRALVKAILVIAEAGIHLLVERIKKRRKRNGHSRKLDHLHYGRDAYDLLNRSDTHHYPLAHRWAVRKKAEHAGALYLKKDRIHRKERIR